MVVPVGAAELALRVEPDQVLLTFLQAERDGACPNSPHIWAHRFVIRAWKPDGRLSGRDRWSLITGFAVALTMFVVAPLVMNGRAWGELYVARPAGSPVFDPWPIGDRSISWRTLSASTSIANAAT